MILQDIGMKHGTDKATFHQYCDFYQDRLPDRDFAGRLLEIGVLDGASLRMWREYYPDAEIIGIDVNPRPFLKIEGVTLVWMDQANVADLATLGDFDVIIDDGSHMTRDQQVTFFWLYFNQLRPGGYYVLEDLHTSYMSNYVNSRYRTLDMLQRLEVDPVLFAREQGKPDQFIKRHGFDDPSIIWTGPPQSDSMTAIMRAERS